MTEISTNINIYNEGDFDLPFELSQLQRLASKISRDEEISFQMIEVIYVDEDEILQINNKYLSHDYVTDIITFSYGDNQEPPVEGTLYCCAPRIAEQADELEVPVRKEFLRIFVHGLLHLVGYDDKEASQRTEMRAKEDHYLTFVENL